MQTKNLAKKNEGFTILEIIVSISLFVIVILLVNSMYSISQKAYNKSSDEAELVQNARVCLDRISREIRQSVTIITAMPNTPTSTPAEEIFFQNGHDINQITYIYYYLDDSDLIRQHRAYEFDSEPGVYVPVGSVDDFGDSPDELILEDRVVGEYFDTLEFWGENGWVNVGIDLSKNQDSLSVDTTVYSRNF